MGINNTPVEFGFMSSNLDILSSDISRLGGSADFIELQVHDKLGNQLNRITQITVLPTSFIGYLTLHGEGETDGKARIHFCSANVLERHQYLSDCVALYRRVIDHFQDRVRRLVLHPDSVDRKVAREAQIQLLAASVAEIKDRLPELQVCIEPRGGDRQNKVLRLELQDILNLKKHLCAIGAFEQIGLCIDLAQAVIVHGNARTIKFLDELNSTDFQILELHLSDVGLDQNRVAVEVGKGRIDWPKLFPSALNCCKAVLIETLGGIKVFQRSQAYLHTLVNNAEILL